MRLLEFFRPFRAVITRRVTEEEQVSVEGFYASEGAAKAGVETFLATMRDHRKRTNDEVVRITQQQLTALETAIEARGETVRELDREIEGKRQKAKQLEDSLRRREESTARSIPRSA